MSAPPPLPPTASFLIPNEARYKNDRKKNDGENVGKQRTISVEIRDTLLQPPPLPEPPTPNAQHYDLPGLDMTKFTRKPKMLLPSIDGENATSEQDRKERRDSILAFKREKNFVKRIFDLFPEPPKSKPDPQGWSDASYLLERRKKQENKDQLFRIILNFSRCDIDEVDLKKLRVLLPRLDSQELKVVVEKAFKVAAQDAGVKTRAKQRRGKSNSMSIAKKGFHGMFSSRSSDNHACHVSLDMYFVKLTGPGGGEIDVDNDLTKSVFRVVNNGRHKIHFSISTIFPEDTTREPTATGWYVHPKGWYKVRFKSEDEASISKVDGCFVVVKKFEAVNVVVEFESKKGDLEIFIPFAVNVAAGPRLLAVVTGRVARSYFGVNPASIPLEKLEDGRKIPKILLFLHQYLKDNNAFDMVGIFRLAADETEILEVTRLLNQDRFKKCNDINCVSTLVKVWFRKLPKQLLADLSVEDLLRCQTEEQSVQLYNKIEPFYRGIFLWVLDIMSDVAMNKDKNKMSPANCAIVMGPNLFSTDQNVNPMQALMISQKAVKILEHLINWRMRNARMVQ
eukprot:g758.t1